jgi:uncharacterized protein (DUF58 family)
MPRSKSSPEAVLQRIDWTVVRRLDGILQGDYRTLLHGFGLDLAEIREYQVFDDVRNIDWNVTARMQTPYVRQYLEDRELTAWFLLDLSPSVDFGSMDRRKREVLVDFVALLARLLTRHGNRVGAILSSGETEGVVPPGNGRLHILRLLHELDAFPRTDRAPFTDLGLLLQSALGIARRRSLVFVVSDFISVPGWEYPLGFLTQKHETLAVRLVDPSEVELPDIGPVLFEDKETGEQLWVDTHDRRFRRRFQEAAQDRERKILAGLGRSGVDSLTITTQGDLVDEVLRFAVQRKMRATAPLQAGTIRA